MGDKKLNISLLSKQTVFYLLNENKAMLEQFDVKRIGLFGSYVKNQQNEESDLDFLVEFKKGEKTFQNFKDLVYFLEELFKIEVEIVTTEALSPYLKPHIIQEVEYASI
jgi:predicted nucleotidyltransferase